MILPSHALQHYKVDVWEAVVTLLFLPLLAVASVLAEWLNNYLKARPKSEVRVWQLLFCRLQFQFVLVRDTIRNHRRKG